MKKIILVLCFLFAAGMQVFAHSPSEIKIEFDPESKLLIATIYHLVGDSKTHYIERIDVRLNGKKVQTVVLKEQDSLLEQAIAVPVSDVKKGDSLSVEAYCSISGKLEKEIKVA
jgi:desulfoferrodoxin (superoxide reductase-like protein)